MPVTDEVLMYRFKVLLLSMVWIGCLIALFSSVEYTKAFLDAAVEIPGRIVALNAGGSHPQVEFTTRRGENISYAQGGWIGGYKVGDKVRVLYLEDSPRTSATIKRIGAIWAWTIVLIPILIMIPLTLVWDLFRKPHRKKGRTNGTSQSERMVF
jgi:hypothetical protein